MIWWGGKCNTLWELKQLWEHSSHRLRFVHTEPEVWVCHSVAALWCSGIIFFVLKTVTALLFPEAFRAGLLSSHCFWDSLGHKEHSSNSKPQGSRAPRHGLEPSQTRHWYYEHLLFLRFRDLFLFFLISSNPGHFLFYFVYLCQLSIFFFFNLAVVGKSSPWTAPTSIAESISSSLRSWPAWRKWKAVVLQALAQSGMPALSLCGSQPRAPSRTAQVQAPPGSHVGSPQQRQTSPSFEESLFCSAFLMAPLWANLWLLTFVPSSDLFG